MHQFSTILIALGFGLALSANAETVYGPCKYDKATLSSLTCYGVAFLNKTTIHGELKVLQEYSLGISIIHNEEVPAI